MVGGRHHQVDRRQPVVAGTGQLALRLDGSGLHPRLEWRRRKGQEVLVNRDVVSGAPSGVAGLEEERQ